MERGPMALFGAIVAVGLGPALWLGAQFGRFEQAPSSPPAAVDRQESGVTQLLGGAGGGDPAIATTTISVTPRAHTVPLTDRRSRSPSSTATDPDPSASASPSGSASPEPSRSSEPTASPSDSPPTSVPPSPPASDPGGGGGGGGGGSSGPTDGVSAYLIKH